MTPPRVSLQSIVRQFLQSLKEVVAIGAVELAAQHATVLETDGRSRRGMDRRPSFSVNSLFPFTTRSPRLTRASDGNPFLRLLVASKPELVEVFGFQFHDTPPLTVFPGIGDADYSGGKGRWRKFESLLGACMKLNFCSCPAPIFQDLTPRCHLRRVLDFLREGAATLVVLVVLGSPCTTSL